LTCRICWFTCCAIDVQVLHLSIANVDADTSGAPHLDNISALVVSRCAAKLRPCSGSGLRCLSRFVSGCIQYAYLNIYVFIYHIIEINMSTTNVQTHSNYLANPRRAPLSQPNIASVIATRVTHTSKPTPTHKQTNRWDVSDLLCEWYRPTFAPRIYPYLPVHITRPKESIRVFVVRLPAECAFFMPPHRELIAVPLFNVYNNLKSFGSLIACIPQLLSRFKFTIDGSVSTNFASGVASVTSSVPVKASTTTAVAAPTAPATTTTSAGGVETNAPVPDEGEAEPMDAAAPVATEG
jgi:hypothetical protein